MTLRQVLDWNGNWSYTDREFIERALAVFDQPEFYIPPSGGYIRVRVNRRITCAVGAGYVWWPDVGVAEGLDPSTIGSAFYTDSSLDRQQLESVSRELGTLPGWSKWQFFTQPKASLGGDTPLKALKDGRFAEARRAAIGFADR